MHPHHIHKVYQLCRSDRRYWIRKVRRKTQTLSMDVFYVCAVHHYDNCTKMNGNIYEIRPNKFKWVWWFYLLLYVKYNDRMVIGTSLIVSAVFSPYRFYKITIIFAFTIHHFPTKQKFCFGSNFGISFIQLLKAFSIHQSCSMGRITLHLSHPPFHSKTKQNISHRTIKIKLLKHICVLWCHIKS